MRSLVTQTDVAEHEVTAAHTYLILMFDTNIYTTVQEAECYTNWQSFLFFIFLKPAQTPSSDLSSALTSQSCVCNRINSLVCKRIFALTECWVGNTTALLFNVDHESCLTIGERCLGMLKQQRRTQRTCSGARAAEQLCRDAAVCWFYFLRKRRRMQPCRHSQQHAWHNTAIQQTPEIKLDILQNNNEAEASSICV